MPPCQHNQRSSNNMLVQRTQVGGRGYARQKSSLQLKLSSTGAESERRSNLVGGWESTSLAMFGFWCRPDAAVAILHDVSTGGCS